MVPSLFLFNYALALLQPRPLLAIKNVGAAGHWSMDISVVAVIPQWTSIMVVAQPVHVHLRTDQKPVAKPLRCPCNLGRNEVPGRTASCAVIGSLLELLVACDSVPLQQHAAAVAHVLLAAPHSFADGHPLTTNGIFHRLQSLANSMSQRGAVPKQELGRDASRAGTWSPKCQLAGIALISKQHLVM